jgi:DNA-directed RNA polymerase subunit H (RpoH/RPB5)
MSGSDEEFSDVGDIVPDDDDDHDDTDEAEIEPDGEDVLESEEEEEDEDGEDEEEEDEGEEAKDEVDDVDEEDNELLWSSDDETGEESRPRVQVTPQNPSTFIFEASNQAFKDYVMLLPSGSVWNTNRAVDMDRVVQQMITARGYLSMNSVDDAKQYLDQTVINIINKTMGEGITIAFNNRGRLCGCFELKPAKVGIKEARIIQEIAKKVLLQEVILITVAGVTPVAKRLLDSSVKNVSIFMRDELNRNYCQHQLVPHQTALTDTEAAQFLKKGKMERKHLPIMNKGDPIAKYHGWTAGTIVCCRRVMGDAHEPHNYYRVVK